MGTETKVRCLELVTNTKVPHDEAMAEGRKAISEDLEDLGGILVGEIRDLSPRVRGTVRVNGEDVSLSDNDLTLWTFEYDVVL